MAVAAIGVVFGVTGCTSPLASRVVDPEFVAATPPRPLVENPTDPAALSPLARTRWERSTVPRASDAASDG